MIVLEPTEIRNTFLFPNYFKNISLQLKYEWSESKTDVWVDPGKCFKSKKQRKNKIDSEQKKQHFETCALTIPQRLAIEKAKVMQLLLHLPTCKFLVSYLVWQIIFLFCVIYKIVSNEIEKIKNASTMKGLLESDDSGFGAMDMNIDSEKESDDAADMEEVWYELFSLPFVTLVFKKYSGKNKSD